MVTHVVFHLHDTVLFYRHGGEDDRRCGAAGLYVGVAQQGVLRGRAAAQQVFRQDARVAGLWRYTSEGGALLLDVQAAYPSLAHSWFHTVLAAMGAPAPLRRAVQAMYTSCASVALPGGPPSPFR